MRQPKDIELLYAFHFHFLPKNEHETRTRLLSRCLEFSKRQNDKLINRAKPGRTTVHNSDLPLRIDWSKMGSMKPDLDLPDLLTCTPQGTCRIAGTRVSLDSVIHAF